MTRTETLSINDKTYTITGQRGAWSVRCGGAFIGGCHGITGAKTLATQHANGQIHRAPRSDFGRRRA